MPEHKEMPKPVMRAAIRALAEGGENLAQWQFNDILTLVHTEQISVKNAAKLMYKMMMSNGGKEVDIHAYQDDGNRIKYI